MNNPWKLATIGLALTGVTATATGLTTAYMLRPPASAQAETTAPAAPAMTRYAPAARYIPAAPAATTAAPVRSAAARTSTPRVVPVAASAPAAAADCSTGTERAMRIAKPGALGALLGAGLGAAGGAIANGGKAAGKGALIGGLAGAALGTGYGAYKTKNECGTILGNGFSGPASGTARADAPQSAFSRASGDEIQVYSAR
jgi:hypothetical protein